MYTACTHRSNLESTSQWTSSGSCQLVQHWTTIGHPIYHAGMLQAKLLRSIRSNSWSVEVLVKNSCWSIFFLGSGCHCLEVTFSKWEEYCCSARVQILYTSTAYTYRRGIQHSYHWRYCNFFGWLISSKVSRLLSYSGEFSVQYGTPWHFMEVMIRLTQGVDVVTESQCNPGHVVCMSLPTQQCSSHETPRKSMWHRNLTATEIYCSYNS